MEEDHLRCGDSTPIGARAYATHDSRPGFIYKIDTTRFEAVGVSAYIVKDVAVQPAIPGDEEITLIAKDGGAVPAEVVVEVLCV